MSGWDFLSKSFLPEGIEINKGQLTYHRGNGSITCIHIDDLKTAKIFSKNGCVYWYLVDQDNAIVVFCESVNGAASVRQYFSSWRGFNYDALLRFSEGDEKQVLWPMVYSKLGAVA